MNEFITKIKAELDTEQFEKDLDKLQKQGINIKVGTGTKDSINDAEESIDKVDKSIKKANKSGKIFGDNLKKSFQIGSAASVAHKAFRLVDKAASDAVKSVKEFDAAITDLRMATNGSYDSARSLAKEFNELGKKLGATTKEMTSGANLWLRQGYSLEETNTLVTNSTILAKIAKLEDAEATEYLTSTMKGYNIEAKNTLGIVDKLTAVDMVSAVDAGGLAEGMSEVATMADDVGISIDRLIGYLAATGEVTQESMSTIGTSFKTILTRMSDIKSGKLELIDEDGTVEILSDVEQTLANVGIDLRETVTSYNDFEDVLDALASKWDSLSQLQQNALAKAFAGTRQQNRFRVLMENYENAKKYADVAANSAGTAASKFEAYLDSIEAKTKTLQASFESLAFNAISTETVGGIVEAANALVVFIDKTNLLKGTLVGLTTAGILKAFTSIKSSISSAAIKLNEFNAAMKMVKAGNLGADEIARLAKMTSTLSQSQLKAVLSSKTLSNEQRIAILTAQGTIGNSMYAGFETLLYKNRFDVAGKTNTATNYTVNTDINNHFETHIEIDHVLDYNDICTKLQNDKQFEKMIQTMTLGRIRGESPLKKYDYSWRNTK